MKNVRRMHEGSTKFPKLEECAHFHYDYVEIKTIRASLTAENQENFHGRSSVESSECCFSIEIVSNDNKPWIVRRSYDTFRNFDKQLHRCIFDRKYSLLPEVRKDDFSAENMEAVRNSLSLYLQRFSSIAGSMINCGPVLSWLEMDNRGNRLLVTDDSSAINTPAVSAGHVIKRYQAQAPDELTLQVGDIISIIDMPRAEETVWWRGKKSFEVGFFPCECIEVIGDTIPQAIKSKIPETPPKPVLRRRGKLITFLRAFFTSRPARAQLKRTGIVKERVFGCDLGEHLLNSKQDVPLILKNCAEVIEEHGIVDGIYRLSGVASNIQKLRNDFDEEKMPDLRDDVYLQDIHSISSLLKAYFRELPNPLLTYQLYDKFSAAVQNEDSKLVKIHDVIQQLPPPHYRTAEFLFRHLNQVSKYGAKTGMHCKNIAIVWAPNLMRSKELDRDLEVACSTAMLQGVGVQAIVTELLIQYADFIFSDDKDTNGVRRSRPKSLAVSTPTKLLSLEEAREHILAGQSNASSKPKYIEVGGGPDNLPAEYHTIIELPDKKKGRKQRKSPSSTSALTSAGAVGGSVASGSSWRNLFSRSSKNLKKQDSTSEDTLLGVENRDHSGSDEKHSKLRAVHSVESLASATSSHSRLSDFTDDVFKLPGEDFKKTQSIDRPKNKKGKKSSRRNLSVDLSQTESEFSEVDEAPVVTMDTDTHAQLKFPPELEEKVSKDRKSSKSAKRSKKKGHARSSSDSPLRTEMFRPQPDASRLCKSEIVTDGDYSATSAAITEVEPDATLSGKERPVLALTPTSPRKKIKARAPSPPRSPSGTPADIPPPTKSKKKSTKKSKVSKTSDEMDKQDEQTGVMSSEGHTASHHSGTVHLSPIDEALNPDISVATDAGYWMPDSQQKDQQQLTNSQPEYVTDSDILPTMEANNLGVPNVQAETPDEGDVPLSAADMSMSFESLLREVSASEVYQSSAANFSTFGKSERDTTATFPPSPEERESKAQSDDGMLFDSRVNSGEPEGSSPTVNRLLETDMDSFGMHPRPMASPVKKDSARDVDDDVSQQDDDERFSFIAPLPGDLQLVSHFSELIAPSVMSQIELDDSDVQYVDPHQTGDPEGTVDQDYPVNQPTLSASTHAVERSLEANRLDDDLVLDLPETQWPSPEPMMTSPTLASNYVAAHPTAPEITERKEDSLKELDTFHKVSDGQNVSQPARIVVESRREGGLEGCTFVSTKSRLVPPPKQFAYMAPPVVTCPVHEEGLDTNIDDVQIDDFLSPPPPVAFMEDSKNSASTAEDDQALGGYMADRCLSSSQGTMDNDDCEERLKAVSQSYANEDQDATDVSLAESKPESNKAGVSLENDPLIVGVSKEVDDLHRVMDTDRDNGSKKSPEAQEMMFEIDDLKVKSNNALHNMNNTSNDEHWVGNQRREEGGQDEKRAKQSDTFCIEKPVSDTHWKQYVRLGSNEDGEPECEVALNKQLLGGAVTDDSVTSKTPMPVKRKKSVKELLSRFETSSSPRSASGVHEVKVKPVVFQKPRIVRKQSLTKLSESDGFEESTRQEPSDHVTAMPTARPNASRLQSLPRTSNDGDCEVGQDPGRSTDTGENSLRQSSVEPLVKNKIQQFEKTVSAESVPSQNEAGRSRQERSPQRSERSPIRVETERAKSPPIILSQRAFPAMKEIVVQELNTSRGEADGERYADTQAALPAAKLPKPSPRPSRQSSSDGAKSEPKPVSRSSFKMRSASSPGSAILMDVTSPEDVSAKQPLSERLKRFERFKMPTEEWRTADSQTPAKPESQTAKAEHDSKADSVETPCSGKTSATVILDSATLENKPAKEFRRSLSPKQTIETGAKRSANVSERPDRDNTIFGTEADTGESDEVLKPSQLFAKRNKRVNEPPAVVQKKPSVEEKEDAEMVSSFSDRRKLFESSTDSGIGSSYGSLKRSEIYMKPKQQNIDPPAKSTPAVVHKEIELSHNKIGQSDSAKRWIAIETHESNINNGSDHCKQFGQTVAEMRSSDLSQDSAKNTEWSSGKGKAKEWTEHKENVKPTLTLKSYEKSSDFAEFERSGSVKDLWRKFEQHNTHM